ncbi:YPDG domain-containing protein [Gemella haemolysans]|uniref:Long Rib domain-containing protein n=1 Tax=Gemella haemolysans ATCC 10379 TaxID=546270 RepID=C5NVD4_9BACL|nr:YPDG domain-containing protein [Gemella haemolysans]EER68809.1 hypothetical protein GEMHA0001_1513 [Gemella haemolysans ATCC 10379]
MVRKFPIGTTFESDKPGIITVDKDGKVTVTIPEGAKPGDKVTGKVTVTYPDGSKEDVHSKCNSNNASETYSNSRVGTKSKYRRRNSNT